MGYTKVFKVKQENKIINKAVYIVMGLNTNGIREVIGMWISETERASFWMQILTELTRGERKLNCAI